MKMLTLKYLSFKIIKDKNKDKKGK
jgi:hypothetical protein